ncbi:hypothetical protein BKA93DRAFT_739464 [Sparassis latifolia]
MLKLRARSEGYPEVLNPSTYLPGLPKSIQPWKLPVTNALNGDELETRVLSTLHSVLHSWLGYPNDTSMMRGVFVTRIIQTFHSENVLLLQGVWCVYSEIKVKVLVTSIPSGTASTSQIPTHQGLQSLLDFVLELIPLVDSTTAFPSTRIQSLVLQQLDKCLPFRECTPSKSRVSGLDGPLHSDNIDKHGAFASACIFRGITFGCPVVQEKPTYFSTEAAWEEMLLSCPRDSSGNIRKGYLCDKTAYGSCISGRDPKRTHNYFIAEEYFHRFLETEGKDGQIGFTQFYTWATRSMRTDCKKILPQMGGLIYLLLAADLCYAGKVRMPDVDEMAKVVAHVEKGAIAGLSLCSLTSAGSSVEEVEEAFKMAYSFLDTHLTVEQKRLIRFDPIMTEHLLCKFQRVDRVASRKS